MAKFNFYQDVLQTMWLRKFFTVEASNLNVAKNIAKQYRNEELTDDEEYDNVELRGQEWMYETAQSLDAPQEDDFSIEILDSLKNVLADNRPVEVYHRFERVFNCTYNELTHGWGVVEEDTVVYDANQQVNIILDDGTVAFAKASEIYRFSKKLKRCPKCNGLLLHEHNKECDYPYYCASCDENFYEFELR